MNDEQTTKRWIIQTESPINGQINLEDMHEAWVFSNTQSASIASGDFGKNMLFWSLWSSVQADLDDSIFSKIWASTMLQDRYWLGHKESLM